MVHVLALREPAKLMSSVRGCVIQSLVLKTKPKRCQIYFHHENQATGRAVLLYCIML